MGGGSSAAYECVLYAGCKLNHYRGESRYKTRTTRAPKIPVKEFWVNKNLSFSNVKHYINSLKERKLELFIITVYQKDICAH